MNILITGANGQLGNEMRVLSKENGQHAGIGHLRRTSCAQVCEG